MPRCTRCFGDLSELAVFCPHCAQAQAPDFNQLLNQTIDGRYRIYRRLGQGGLSTVFAATDLQLDQVVVVKVSDPAQLVRREQSFAIEPEAARHYWTEMLERMRREAETLAALTHPHIVRFYATGLINDDLRYAVMEFLRGQMLRDTLAAQGRLETPEAIRIAQAIIAALDEVHRRGIIHRDINPRNVMLCEEGEDRGTERQREGETESSDTISVSPSLRLSVSNVKLIDFGIAKFPQPPGAPPFTQHTVLSGTVAYAAPEQCQSRPLDHRADIYSLGVVLYEMLTGARPFTGRTPTEIALKQIQAEPTAPRALNPELPEFIEQAILRALAKDPDARQQSVAELGDELRNEARRIVIPLAAAADEVDEALLNEVRLSDDEEAATEERLRLARRRRRRMAVVAAAMMLALVTTGLLFGRQLLSSRRAMDAANIAANGASPTPATGEPAPGSDADALELAARLSQEISGLAMGAALPTSTPAASPAAVNSSLPDESKAARTPAATPTATPAPTPAPPRAQPQTPPAPTPTIAIARAPQSTAEPDLAQAPRRDSREDTANVGRRHEDQPPADTARQPERDERASANRNGAEDRAPSYGSYRYPPRPKDDETDDDDRAPREQIGPKLIQWNGTVNRERVIKIELPGAPGTLEVPRLYRDRVGVVEPPSPDNRWRCAVLRVYGRGSVSIVVRWWPLARNVTRLAEYR